MSALTKTAPSEEPKLKLCMLNVVHTYDLTPVMRRIMLGGKDLEPSMCRAMPSALISSC